MLTASCSSRSAYTCVTSAAGVTEQYLRGFQSVLLANLRRECVAELVGVPVRSLRFDARPRDGMGVTRHVVHFLWLPLRVRFPLRGVTCRLFGVARCLAVRGPLRSVLCHRPARGEQVVGDDRGEELFQHRLRSRPDSNGAGFPSPSVLVVRRLVEPHGTADVDVCADGSHRLHPDGIPSAVAVVRPVRLGDVAVEMREVWCLPATSSTGSTGPVSRATVRPRWSPPTAASAW